MASTRIYIFCWTKGSYHNVAQQSHQITKDSSDTIKTCLEQWLLKDSKDICPMSFNTDPGEIWHSRDLHFVLCVLATNENEDMCRL